MCKEGDKTSVEPSNSTHIHISSSYLWMLLCCSWFHQYVSWELLYADEDSAKEEARSHIKDGRLAYSNADVVVKLQGWDADHVKTVAQACLSALKQLVLSDKELPGIIRIILQAFASLCFWFCFSFLLQK